MTFLICGDWTTDARKIEDNKVKAYQRHSKHRLCWAMCLRHMFVAEDLHLQRWH